MLPIILGVAAAIAGISGAGAGIHGGVMMKEANDTMESAKSLQRSAIENYNAHAKTTTELMDLIGTRELNILKSFDKFSDLIEKVQNKPEFKKYSRNGVEIPKYEPEKIRDASVGANALLAGIGGTAAGTAGGIAAGGATYAIAMLGTASTGTAIASLSGAAATNAALATLGGGAIGSSAMAGGMAAGSMVLGGATLGVGLLIGGIIFNATGSKLSDEADEAFRQAIETSEKTNEIVKYLDDLYQTANKFFTELAIVDNSYQERLNKLDNITNRDSKINWNKFTDREKNLTENTILLVGMLYKMCQVNLVIKTDDRDGINTVNHDEIDKSVHEAKMLINGMAA